MKTVSARSGPSFWKIAAFVLVAVVVQLFRSTGISPLRTVWAEDGTVFWRGAQTESLFGNLLEPYAGYAHAMPRILAELGAALPAANFSVFVALICALIVALLCVFTFFASVPLLGSGLRRYVFAGALLLLPVASQEISLSLANLQWYLPIPAFFAVFIFSEKFRAFRSRGTLALLGPATSPLTAMMAPVVGIAFVKEWRDGKSEDSSQRQIVRGLFLVSAFVQAIVYMQAVQEKGLSLGFVDFIKRVGAYFRDRVVTNLIAGTWVPDEVWPQLGAVFGSACLLLVLVILGRKFQLADMTARTWIAGLFGLAIVLTFFQFSKRTGMIVSSISPQSGGHSVGASRYEVVPSLLILLALLIRPRLGGPESGDGPTHAESARSRLSVEFIRHAGPTSVVLGTVVWLIVAVIPSYRTRTDRGLGPAWPEMVSKAKAECRSNPGQPVARLRVTPAGAKLFTDVPCANLK